MYLQVTIKTNLQKIHIFANTVLHYYRYMYNYKSIKMYMQ
jgi:hypothetical protein